MIRFALLITTISLLFFSCKSNSTKTTKRDYTIKITNTKVNPKSFTRESSVGPDSIGFKNTTLKAILANLLNTKEGNIKSNKVSHLNQALNLNFKNNSSDNSENREIILSHLSKKYHFKLLDTFQRQEKLSLIVEDDSKLEDFTSNYSNTHTITTEAPKTGVAAKIILQNASLKDLAKALSTYYKKNVADKTDVDDDFDITVQANSLENLSPVLENQFGLSVEKSLVDTKYWVVSF